MFRISKEFFIRLKAYDEKIDEEADEKIDEEANDKQLDTKIYLI